MSTPKKYVLHPGYVRSAIDGDIHHISDVKLIQLYRVNPRECIQDSIYKEGEWMRGYTIEELQKLIHLYPRQDGDYRVDMPRKLV